MSRKLSNKNYFKSLQKEISDNYEYINSLEVAPKMASGIALEKIDLNPKNVFHFLEFIFQKSYVDLYKERGIVFIDNKINWEFLIKTKHGYIKIYDWKGYSISVGSYGFDPTTEIKSEAVNFKKIIEEGTGRFLDFRKESFKEELDERPLDNFMNALVSLEILLKASLENNKNGMGFIESLIIFVSLIDTLLRYSILLTRINERKSTRVDSDLPKLFHQEGDDYFSERAIFKMAEKEIDFKKYSKKKFFREANLLYNERNKAVHRYAITNFQYIEIKETLEKYKHLKDILYKIVVKLEREQADLGVGFIQKDELKGFSEEENKQMFEKILEQKINPSIITKKQPKRDAMFDQY